MPAHHHNQRPTRPGIPLWQVILLVGVAIVAIALVVVAIRR
jgi:hypothetical protein